MDLDENQFDFIGGDNANHGSGEKCCNWLDLFAWGASGRDHGAICYQPWCCRQVFEDEAWQYNAYGVDTFNLYDGDGRADWGYNAISNGGNEEKIWRTLTIEEWDYILEKRTTATGIRYAKAAVHGVRGLLLLPDDWDSTYCQLRQFNNDDVDYIYNNLTEPFWTEKAEAQGAVFLPAAGIRDFSYVGLIGKYGHYWSSSCLNPKEALGIYFSNSFFYHSITTDKCSGRSVRLVRDK